MIPLFFFLFGLIIGSFLNVVVYRIRTETTMSGRSFCPHCKHLIHWYDNVPVLSFLLLRARCRNCKQSISWQYPLTEFFSGIVFLGTAAIFFDIDNIQSLWDTIFYLVLFSFCIIIFVYDLLTMYIPMVMIWLGIAWIFLFKIIQNIVLYGFHQETLYILLNTVGWDVLAGCGAFLFFYALVFFSKERWMGMGDAYLAFLIGMIVGWPGVVWAIMFSFWVGAVISIALLAFKKKGMKSQVPFAPFMIIGVLLAIFLPVWFPELAMKMMLY